MVVPPVGVVKLHAAKLQQGGDHTHQRTTGDEARRDKRTLFATRLVQLLVLAACGDKPVDCATHEQRQVELDGDKHTEREGQCRHLAAVEHQGHDGANAVEQPRCALSAHQRLDDGSHGVGLRSSQRVTLEAVGLVQ